MQKLFHMYLYKRKDLLSDISDVHIFCYSVLQFLNLNAFCLVFVIAPPKRIIYGELAAWNSYENVQTCTQFSYILEGNII